MTFYCPLPDPWNRIYQELVKAWEATQIIPPPPKPLILAAWHTPIHLRHERWQQTLSWAEKYGFSELIPEFTAEQIYREARPKHTDIFWTAASLEDIRHRGFDGFLSFQEIRTSGGQLIPAVQGVYLVLLPGGFEVKFLEVSAGGRFKGRDPSVAVRDLENKWVANTHVVYIGSARNLRQRIRQYSHFGEGKPAAHYGGRHIWQIEGGEHLLVCWTEIEGDPKKYEKELIGDFQSVFGRLPFANMRR